MNYFDTFTPVSLEVEDDYSDLEINSYDFDFADDDFDFGGEDSYLDSYWEGEAEAAFWGGE